MVEQLEFKLLLMSIMFFAMTLYCLVSHIILFYLRYRMKEDHEAELDKIQKAIVEIRADREEICRNAEYFENLLRMLCSKVKMTPEYTWNRIRGRTLYPGHPDKREFVPVGEAPKYSCMGDL